MKFPAILLVLVALVTTASCQMEMDKTRSNSVIAHATCMGFAFAFLMPFGAMIVRIAKVHNLVWYHAAIMVLAYVLALAGLGLGVYIAIVPESQLLASNGHPIIGIVVVGLLLLQPPLGLLHHYRYKSKHGQTTSAILHVWWGRALITLAIINGGLGLQLSGNSVKGEIAYGVIAGVMWLAWVILSTTSSFTSSVGPAETGEKISKKELGGSHGSSENAVGSGNMA